MTELGIALGVALVLEGIFYALFPDSARRLMAHILSQPPAYLRRMGLLAAFGGLATVWFLKG